MYLSPFCYLSLPRLWRGPERGLYLRVRMSRRSLQEGGKQVSWPVAAVKTLWVPGQQVGEISPHVVPCWCLLRPRIDTVARAELACRPQKLSEQKFLGLNTTTSGMANLLKVSLLSVGRVMALCRSKLLMSQRPSVSSDEHLGPVVRPAGWCHVIFQRPM